MIKKIKNSEVSKICQGLTKLRENETALPADISYAIVRNVRTLIPIAEDYLTFWTKICEQYGKQQEREDGTIVYAFKTKEDSNKAKEAISNLDNTENEVMIMMIDLDRLQGYNLSVEDMDNLYFMIKDGEG